MAGAGTGQPQQPRMTPGAPRFTEVGPGTPRGAPAPMAAQGGGDVFQNAASSLGMAQSTAGNIAGTPTPTLAGANLQPFQNPFQQQVIDPVLGDIERQRQMAINNVGAQATGAGAFGGSRQGVAESLTNQAAMQEAARASGQLRSQGFNTAQNLAQQDIANQLAGGQLGLSAAGTLGNLANLGFGFGTQIQNQQAQQGLQQQQLMQQLINAARGQFQGFTGSPAASTQLPLQAIGSVPVGQTTTQSRTPGLFDFLSLGLAL